MAADYARVQRAIWSDDDFRELGALAQWLYFHLLTSPSLNYAGVTDWRPARIAALTGDMRSEDVERASLELEVNAYTVVDRDSEEVLIRSFVRHDGLMEQWNMAAAMVKAHSAVASRALRGVIVHELKRLHTDSPDLKGWGRGEVALLLRRAAIDPTEARELLQPNPLLCPPESPNERGNQSPNTQGSDWGCPTPTPSPTPLSSGSTSHHESPGDETREIGKPQRRKAANG
jgi:hypothetical protein